MNADRVAVAAIVLAAGESKRMGTQNKLLLPFNNKPVIRHVVEAIVDADAASVNVVVGHEQEQVREALDGCPVTLIENPDYKEGMGTSIRAGVKRVNEGVAGYMMCLSDLPLVTVQEYASLVSAFAASFARDEHTIVIPRHNNQRGNPVLLSHNYRDDMLALQGHDGCRGIIKKHQQHVQFVDMATNHVLTDIDTREAYDAVVQGTR